MSHVCQRLRIVKGMLGWEPWPAKKAALEAKVREPSWGAVLGLFSCSGVRRGVERGEKESAEEREGGGRRGRGDRRGRGQARTGSGASVPLSMSVLVESDWSV